jgi:hypothetical protein
MKIKFNKKGVFELYINNMSSLIFTKKDDGTIAITMPCYYNETTKLLSGFTVHHVLSISGTDEQIKEQMENAKNPS